MLMHVVPMCLTDLRQVSAQGGETSFFLNGGSDITKRLLIRFHENNFSQRQFSGKKQENCLMYKEEILSPILF